MTKRPQRPAPSDPPIAASRTSGPTAMPGEPLVRVLDPHFCSRLTACRASGTGHGAQNAGSVGGADGSHPLEDRCSVRHGEVPADLVRNCAERRFRARLPPCAAVVRCATSTSRPTANETLPAPAKTGADIRPRKPRVGAIRCGEDKPAPGIQPTRPERKPAEHRSAGRSPGDAFGLITRRSQVQILPPPPHSCNRTSRVGESPTGSRFSTRSRVR